MAKSTLRVSSDSDTPDDIDRLSACVLCLEKCQEQQQQPVCCYKGLCACQCYSCARVKKLCAVSKGQCVHYQAAKAYRAAVAGLDTPVDDDVIKVVLKWLPVSPRFAQGRHKIRSMDHTLLQQFLQCSPATVLAKSLGVAAAPARLAVLVNHVEKKVMAKHKARRLGKAMPPLTFKRKLIDRDVDSPWASGVYKKDMLKQDVYKQDSDE